MDPDQSTLEAFESDIDSLCGADTSWEDSTYDDTSDFSSEDDDFSFDDDDS